MKQLITISFAIALFISCTKYAQVVCVNSPILQNDTLLRHNNDTFEIVYNLFDANGLVSFTVFNNSSTPLYIDWKRSAYIVGTQKTDYWQDETHIQMVSTGNNIKWLRWYGTQNNYSVGVMTQPEKVTFIPPHTAITMSRFRIGGDFKLTEPSDTLLGTTKPVKAKKQSYTPDNTPLAFRNFLTLSLKHDFSEEFYIDHHFWVSKIMEMKEQYLYTVTNADHDFTPIYTFPDAKPNRYYIQMR